jgi:uncharacterized protein YprB with RNaseH-like and TPR domain
MADKDVALSKKLERLKKERETRERAVRIQKDLEEKARPGVYTAHEEPDDESQTGLENPDGVQDDAARLDYSQSNETPASRRKSSPETPGRSEQIRKTWSEINKDDSVPLKSKLEQLIALRSPSFPKIQPPSRPPTRRFVPDEVEPRPREPLKILENSYAPDTRYGNINIADGLRLSGELLACLGKDDAFRGLDLSSALFFDLETTGLSGGAGVIPFLVGLGFYRDDRFHVLQYFLGEPAEEERMIDELVDFFAEREFKSIVTYNGKVFDLPLLETRFIINRRSLVLTELPHLDFLFPARRLWRHKYESCRLYNLALEVINTGRTEDIPSAEIPWRYFQYLRTGDFELVDPIIYHNAEDILSLLGLVISGGQIFSDDPESSCSDAMDLFGAGKILESYGDEEESIRYFERALNGRLSGDLTLSVKRRLSRRFKKSGEWEKAVALWEEMVDNTSVTRDSLFSFRELAMYFEHRKKDYEKARLLAEEGMVASFGFSAAYESDFRRRLERIKEKLKKLSAG